MNKKKNLILCFILPVKLIGVTPTPVGTEERAPMFVEVTGARVLPDTRGAIAKLVSLVPSRKKYLTVHDTRVCVGTAFC